MCFGKTYKMANIILLALFLHTLHNCFRFIFSTQRFVMIHLSLSAEWGYIFIILYNPIFICFIQPLLGLSLAYKDF